MGLLVTHPQKETCTRVAECVAKTRQIVQFLMNRENDEKSKKSKNSE
jgi:hypothetical protein